MTVVDVRAPKRPTARPRKKPEGLPVLEPGLSRSATLRLAIAVVAVGAVLSMVAGSKEAVALKVAFLLAGIVGSLLGRPSTLRGLLQALPIAWALGVLATGLAISTEPTAKTKLLDVGQDLVLWAAWLWIGWGITLLVTFARGGLHRRPRDPAPPPPPPSARVRARV